jgi:hypothetical protein
MRFGVWLAAVGALSAIALGATSRGAGRLRLLPDPLPPSPAQKRYARAAGTALVGAGALAMVGAR